MTGTLCLQGGAEFSPRCREMDAPLVAGADGPVVVTALAGAPGREYATANRNGVAYYRALGAADVVAAPDAREDAAGALAVLRSARVLVLPGGSPTRLLSALGHPGVGDLGAGHLGVGEVVRGLLATGGTVIGSSAGAMVLGSWTVLPDRAGGPVVVPGLGLAPAVLVVPHWTGPRRDWLRVVEQGVPDDTVVLGVPEESGVVLRGNLVTAVGTSPSRLVRQGRDLALGRPSTLEELRR